MFEQATIETPRRPWAMATSLTLQCAFAGGIVLASILSIQQLPSVSLPSPLPPYRRAPEAVQLVPVPKGAPGASSPISPHIFQQPRRIPDKVVEFVDAMPFVPGAIAMSDGPATPMNGILGNEDLFRSGTRPAPPPEPTAHAATQQTQEAARIRLGGVVMEAKLLRRVMPEYPALARQARISGRVRLMGVIGRDGAVRELKLISGHPLLAPAALNAVRQWLYTPTLLNGEPVEVVAPIEVNFVLSQ